ncbi:TetR/AcrR family transcriptional regulator [Kutzneria sp. CA-103260]|uniref:TetR/AcrR family transcriptional regulator n=1 Tax=Kutzneria sp. CA-103260 TaxID=2802641 RepID=UPI001BA5FEFF|nr:TetR/AcrR family transcriptional regulator [Kutzneria sp. CA-103260]QUQ64086.1 TetR/AcrR family transcriptional regulator [Kutzneria sp. CA-103260]
MSPRSSDAGAKANATPSGSYHHGDLKRALVAAARELVAEKGPQGFTMTEAAKRAGVSVAAPYRHFADKDALLAEVAEQGFVIMGQALDRAYARGREPRDLAVRMARAYVRWAVANPDYYRVMFGDAYGVEDFDDVRPAGRQLFEKLLDVIQACQAAGVIRPQDPRAVAGPLWSVMHGIALLQIGRKFRAVGIRESADSLTTRTVTALLDSPEIAAAR